MPTGQTPNPRTAVRSAAVWRSTDLADASEWTVILSDGERREIVEAVRAARGAGVAITTVDAASFPLPTLASRATEWSALLNEGRGFLLLRRFPVDLLEDADVELAYIGLGTHLGNPVGQDREATVLGHVRDEGVERTHPGVRFYRTRERQDFHADGADLVGLLCLHRARTGGESRIVSSAALYNELLEAIANDPAFYLEMDFQPGDVQFLNNARILHAREAYEDGDDPDQRRHLLRLWLAAHHFTSVDELLQGGIPRQQPAPDEDPA